VLVYRLRCRALAAVPVKLVASRVGDNVTTRVSYLRRIGSASVSIVHKAIAVSHIGTNSVRGPLGIRPRDGFRFSQATRLFLGVALGTVCSPCAILDVVPPEIRPLRMAVPSGVPRPEQASHPGPAS
jgi:hypothetical protein